MKSYKGFRNIFLGLFATAFAIGATGCSDDLEIDQGIPEGPTLRISTGSSYTRANDGHYPDDVNAERNEEALHRVDIFFFSDANDTEGSFFVYETSIDEQVTADLNIKIPIELITNFSNLTATGGEGYAYVLVNLPDAVTVDADAKTINGQAATLENLKQTWVSEPEFITPGLPSDFVMRGNGNISVTKQGSIWMASGYVPLERLAAKVRLMAELPEKIYIDLHGNTLQQGEDESDEDWEVRKSQATEIWEPAPGTVAGDGDMRLYFYNVATNGRIDADISDRTKLGYQDVDRRTEYEDVIRTLHSTAPDSPYYDEKYTYSHDIPYYSYPNKWDSSLASEEHKSYLIIMIPWKRTFHKTEGTDEFYQLCYYQVPVNALQNGSIQSDRMDPNTYYRIKIRLGTLGNRDYGSPSEVKEASYEVLRWVANDVDVSIKPRRYLVVNQHEWEMNNIETLEIPFTTSHKTIVTGCYVTYFRYNDVWGNEPLAQPKTAQDREMYAFNNHNKDEFGNWLKFADAQLAKKRDGEGPIIMTQTTDGLIGDLLYYKREHFYDDWYGAFQYYVGHEHPITFQPDKITRDAAAGDEGEWAAYQQEYGRKYGVDAIYNCTIDDARSVIKFKHPLIQWETVRDRNGRITHYKPMRNIHEPDYFWDEFSRVEIVITIRHEDWTTGDGLFEETVYITQYPGIYITVSHNYSNADSNDYVMVNGAKNRVDSHYDYVDILGNWFASNTNPNMYLIHTTQFSPEFRGKYIIGDPRTLYQNNYLSTVAPGVRPQTPYDESLIDQKSNETLGINWTNYQWTLTNQRVPPAHNVTLVTAPTASNRAVRRQLAHYYPSDESNAFNKEQFIAPVFRMASSYGRTKVNGRIEMRRRCAAYQEAGRPAGRWRVPTKAEIEYVALLSADRKIPILYGSVLNPDDFGYYWAASGGVRANSHGVVESTVGDPAYLPGGYYGVNLEGILATRCVYDEWYWNMVDNGEFAPEISGPKETTFFWGDMIKDNTQE